MHAHLSGNVSQHDVPVLQLDPESRIRKILKNLPLHLNNVVFRHAVRYVTPLIAVASRPCRSTRFEIRFLQQGFVLLALNITLNLRPEIHRHHHDDQQRGTAEIKRHVVLQHQEFRQ